MLPNIHIWDKHRFLLAIFLWLYIGPTLASAWPEIVDPPRSKVVWVGDNMSHNGVEMQIKSFASDLDVKGIIDFYRDRWASLMLQGKPVENDLGVWKVIGYQQGDYLVTVQARPQEKKGSEGHLAVTKLPTLKKRPELDSTFPRLPGTEIISDTLSQDGGKIDKTMIFINNHSVQSNQKYYEEAMSLQGWTSSQPAGAKSDTRGAFLYFQRRKEACSLAIGRNPHGGSVITASLQSTSL